MIAMGEGSQSDLATRVIPCLDVDRGRVVKGVKFVDIVDAGDPVELAAHYDRCGADEIVFLDITASSDARDTICDVVERTADQVFIPLTVGGGVRRVEDVSRLLHSGADKVAINTAAVNDPGVVAEAGERFGAQCIVVAIDARRNGDSWEVYTHGGRTPTGLDAIVWGANVEALGAGEILLTSMDRDGTKLGYDIELLRAMRRATTIPIIASGGVGSLDHLVEGSVDGGADALLAASIFHFGEYSIAEAKAALAAADVIVR